MAEQERRVTRRNHGLFRYADEENTETETETESRSQFRYAIPERLVQKRFWKHAAKPHPTPTLDLHFLDSEMNSGVDSLDLPPELWLKIAWYILIYPDREKDWGRFRKSSIAITIPYGVPIFGLGYCQKTASALLEIPILGRILKHYLVSMGGLTYKELAMLRRRFAGSCEYKFNVLVSISLRSLDPKYAIVGIWHNSDGVRDHYSSIYAQCIETVRASGAVSMGKQALNVATRWMADGCIHVQITWIHGDPDWRMACDSVNQLLPYGIQICDMAGFMEHLTVAVPFIDESGEVDAIMHTIPPDTESRRGNFSKCIASVRYSIDPESIVSRDILRFRPNT
jgi:hypothetical protein